MNSYTHINEEAKIKGIDTRKRYRSYLLDQYANGTDTLDAMIDCVQNLDKDIFWSMRMNDLMRMIRALTEKYSMEREKPVLISIYVPDCIELCKDMGLYVTLNK